MQLSFSLRCTRHTVFRFLAWSDRPSCCRNATSRYASMCIACKTILPRLRRLSLESMDGCLFVRPDTNCKPAMLHGFAVVDEGLPPAPQTQSCVPLSGRHTWSSQFLESLLCGVANVLELLVSQTCLNQNVYGHVCCAYMAYEISPTISRTERERRSGV